MVSQKEIISTRYEDASVRLCLFLKQIVPCLFNDVTKKFTLVLCFIFIPLFQKKYIGEFIKREYQVGRSEEYYFDHSVDYIADATHQGNKTRYLNHSLKPNIEARHQFVNGEKKIAFYAKQDIPAQTEVRHIYIHIHSQFNVFVYFLSFFGRFCL